MTLHLHHLLGCAPAPLAFYLKALGILRTVAEQKDPAARGWWQDEHFCLLTTLDRRGLEQFFLEEYAPTPFVSPWNKGSGFYSDRDPALSPLAASKAKRFSAFREGISAGRRELDALVKADAAVRALKERTKAKKGMSEAEKRAAVALREDPDFKRALAEAERKFKNLKADLFTPCLRSWRGAHRSWLDAALVWLEEGKPVWPALLGTGGNDGRLDFTNNAMQRIGELFDLESPEGCPRPAADDLLRQAIWSDRSDKLVPGAAIGQFLPGGAGGPNSTSGADGDSLINPWDFLLMLEGAMLFSARATRRLDPNATSRASAPFAVRAHPVGHGTRGREKDDRGEQWMPLWTQPTSSPALRETLGEARLQLGRQVAHRPLDVARAISRLGVARGITAFSRFGYLERNGQSRIAVPLGRIDVRLRPRARLIDDLAPWLDRLQRLTRDPHAPTRLQLCEGVLADAVFAVLTHDDAPDRWQAVLLAAAEVEAMQACGAGIKAGPIPPLSPEWLDAADDGSVEWRLACALGSAAAAYWQGRPRDPVRHHWLPLRPGARRFLEQERQLARDPRVVMFGRDAVADCGALVERRMVEAAQRGERRLPLVAARDFAAHPADLAALVAGNVDLARTFSLACALMAVRWEQREGRNRIGPPWDGACPDEPWLALRLACLPWPIEDGRAIPADLAMVRRLLAGDGVGAVDVALRGLRSAGLRPPLVACCAGEMTARRWAAALAFPIDKRWARTLARHFQSSPNKENR